MKIQIICAPGLIVVVSDQPKEGFAKDRKYYLKFRKQIEGELNQRFTFVSS